MGVCSESPAVPYCGLKKVKVNKLAMLIRRGIIKTKAEREREAKEKAKPKYYNVWSSQEEREKSRSQISREKMAFPAPKLPLPGHAER